MNVTIISDIHLAHFTSYSFYEGFRDEQFVRLANRIVEIAKENSSETLLIAGDLIDHPLLSSDESHLFAIFIDILRTQFTDIKYILGQHDLAHRNDEIKYSDSVVNLYDRFSKMEYCNDKSFILGGRTFYMRNFYPGIVKKCPTGTDVYVGHVTLDKNYGQEFEDHFSFKLGIFGDIHTPVDIGNCHSIGCPLQKSLSDNPFGTIVILNTDDLSWKRVRVIDEKTKFLRIYREGTEESPDEYTWIIKKFEKVSTVKLSTPTNHELEVSLADINNLIDSQIKERGLSEIHEEFKYKVPPVEIVDLNYKINKLKIRNFLSINELDLDFNQISGLCYIFGKNGSGKSSLIMALKIALIGSQRIKEYQKLQNSKKLELIVDLEYHGTSYTIYRTPGKTGFYINGKLSNGSSKKDTDQLIFQTLPFLNYVELFNINYQNLFFNRFRDSKLLENMFGIQSLVNYLNLSTLEIKGVNAEIKQLNLSKSNLEGQIESIKEDGKATKEEYLSFKVEDESIFDNAESKLQELISIPRLINSDENTLKDIESHEVGTNPYKKCSNTEAVSREAGEIIHKIQVLKDIDTKTRELDNINYRISMDGHKCPNCQFVEHTSNYNGLVRSKASKEDEITNLRNQICPSDTLESLNSRLDSLREIKNQHLSYVSFQKTMQKYEDSKIRLRESIFKNKKKLNSILNGKSVEECTEELNQLISLRHKIKIYQARLEELKTKYINKTKELNSIVVRISELEEKLKDLEKYKSLFSKDSEESIYSAIIGKIGEGLSDENLKFVVDDDKLILRYKVDSDWIEYDNCSSGEKALADLMLLNKLLKLTGQIGVLTLDEVASNLDVNKYDTFTQIVSEYETNNTLLTMHSELFRNYDHSIEVKRIENNSTFTIQN